MSPAAAAGLVVVLAGCGAAGAQPGHGRVEVVWGGASKGQMRGTATAVWCKAARIAQVTAILGDTGLGLLLRSRDSLATGAYPITEPTASHDSAEPTAALGLRLITQVAVAGYQGRSGSVVLERIAPTGVSGRFSAKAGAPGNPADTISLSGRFTDVPVARGGPACPP